MAHPSPKQRRIVNTFHQTAILVTPDQHGRITQRQVKIAWRKLCGIGDCCCGGTAGQRPISQVEIDEDGSGIIVGLFPDMEVR